MEERYQSYQKDQLKIIMHYVLLFLLAFTLISFVGCGSDSSTGTNDTENPNGPGDPGNEQGPNEVWMVGNTFNVSNLEVSAGTTVTWTNNSSVNHTVTSGSRGESDAGELFNSGTISPGGQFTHTFEDAGEYEYFCEFHSGMSAEVTVSE